MAQESTEPEQGNGATLRTVWLLVVEQRRADSVCVPGVGNWGCLKTVQRKRKCLLITLKVWSHKEFQKTQEHHCLFLLLKVQQKCKGIEKVGAEL